ncbi:MAG: fimbrillin family protein, partial [Bacteroides sp.]
MKINLKNPTWITDGMAIMMLCALFSSCSNEDFSGEKDSAESCDKICFGLTSGSEAATRGLCDAQQEAYTDSRFVLRSEGSADSLCLRAVVSDGIYSSQQQEQQAITRGLPVTGINDFHNKFHVLAYWSRNNTLMNTFFMNEDATNNGSNLWSTERIYYWPGAEHSLQFCAWAPSDATNLVAPSTPQSKQLTYTVPSEATDQKDILVALTEAIDGTNKSTAVPLTFKHICSQIRFVVGSEMQPGTIQSVALKNVACSGTYDMATESWALSTETTSFTQTLNKKTTGNEQSGDAITTNEGTFMMLPQTLGSTAQVEVVFLNENNETRTLSASITDTQWPMGKTVTYRLTITP